jgi:hypothetical protein
MQGLLVHAARVEPSRSVATRRPVAGTRIQRMRTWGAQWARLECRTCGCHVCIPVGIRSDRTCGNCGGHHLEPIIEITRGAAG